MGHIRRDLTFYDGNTNRQFFARTINSVGLSVKVIAGQIAAAFGIYDANNDLISGFESDGDLFAPNIISRYGQPDEFDLNSFFDAEQFGENSSWTLDETNNLVIARTEYANGDIKFASIPLSDDPNTQPAAASLIETKTYNETISALKLVSGVNDTNVEVADPAGTFENATVMGIATLAGLTSDKRPISLFGKVEDLSFNYPVNTPLYLGLNGNITDVPPSLPTFTYSVNVGYSLGTGAVFINIREPIEL